MAVLIEGYSIVVNKAQAARKADALAALSTVDSSLHPMALCADNDLLRIGFLDLQAVRVFMTALQEAGLINAADAEAGQSADMVMVTQFGEMEGQCDWLKVQFTKLKDNTLICLAGLNAPEAVKGVAMPKGWTLEHSILKRFFEERSHFMDENYEFVRSEPMHTIYRNPETQREVRLLKLSYVPADKADLQ
ncbi:hypothetical protein [Thiomicrorhabdus cannonii]|uniref:hypothetical protein n=1 Tax=Thiomicrorhabdus cannonii TaxID=2748011 RepID=UPI0015B8B855|nr:hypothetical protein [Thiomicrorhabdus cannonii]